VTRFSTKSCNLQHTIVLSPTCLRSTSIERQSLTVSCLSDFAEALYTLRLLTLLSNLRPVAKPNNLGAAVAVKNPKCAAKIFAAEPHAQAWRKVHCSQPHNEGTWMLKISEH